MMRQTAVLIVVLLAVVAWQGHSCGQARATSEARADSVRVALARGDSIISVRDAMDLIRSVEAGHLSDSLSDAMALLARERLVSNVRVGELEEMLADSGSGIPDTVRIVVDLAIGALKKENAICRSALTVCDSLRGIHVLQLAARDSTIEILGFDRTRLNELYREADKRTRPSIFRRTGRSLPFMVVAFALGMIVGR